MTPTPLTKATVSLLELGRDAVARSGASSLLLMPEGSMDWLAIRTLGEGVRIFVAVATDRHRRDVRPRRRRQPVDRHRPPLLRTARSSRGSPRCGTHGR